MGVAIPLAMMAAGTGLSAWSQYQQGLNASAQAKAQANISMHNAMVAEAQGEAIKQKSIFDQIRAVKHGARITGQMRAQMGTAGAVLSEGAPADVVAEQAAQNALDVALIGYEGIVGAKEAESQAAMYRYSAMNQARQADYYAKAGAIGAGTTLLGGFGTMAGMGAFGNIGSGGSLFGGVLTGG